MDAIKPVRRPAASHADYSNDSFRQERRESALQQVKAQWTVRAKNRVIAALKKIFGPQLGQSNAQAQFPKPKTDILQTAKQSQPTVGGAKNAKKQVPPAVQHLAGQYMRKPD